ncbi:PqqD family protein [Nocardiopsis sp. RSe5-2]|uniref:PqqD family protein n=1 Tax=Nocardiopsis endophytica TaxID=3018445 RepID=A0ABT4TXY1_9ACTN|nr:PqqD family protein [Nocardiopsis endophytica]MDA2809549.1 PqqD family protein [Nocardiopsis endophytica]
MLLDVRGRGRWTFLSPTAAYIWAHLSADGDVKEASAAVADHYRVDPAMVEIDTRALAEDLLTRELLVLDGGGSR